jgi:hypothetical protein
MQVASFNQSRKGLVPLPLAHALKHYAKHFCRRSEVAKGEGRFLKGRKRMTAGIWSATNQTAPWRKLLAAFRRGLQNLRWIEGRNVNIEER